jgi:hypothetical protein
MMHAVHTEGLPNPSAYFSFCPPPPGKPDSKKLPDSTSKQRPRIVQSPQKGDTCMYYALQILRNEKKPIKNPEAPRQLQPTAAEKSISKYRKIQTRIDQYFPVDNAKFLAERTASGVFTQTDALSFMVKHLSRKDLKEVLDSLYNALTIFCEQDEDDDFFHFIEELHSQKIMQARLSLLEENGITLPLHEIKDTKRRQLAVEDQVKCLMTYVYKAQKSPWHPSQPIEKLIENLNLYGPHLVIGKFGQNFYQTNAIKLPETIAGRTILGWPEHVTRINENEAAFHAVVIVGATVKEEKSCAYFIDPLDGSDSSDINTQKIYEISYQELKASIANLLGIQQRASTGSKIFLPIEKRENKYALYI